MKNTFKSTAKNQQTVITEINKSKKGFQLETDILLDWQLLPAEEKKEKYKLLEIGEFKDVVLSHDEQFFVQSNLPKRFMVSHDFNWGYFGTGPTDLALSLLLQFSNEDLDFTHAYYHDLKEDLIQYLPQNKAVTINGELLLKWIAQKRNKPPRFNTTFKPVPCEPDRTYNNNHYAELRPKESQTENIVTQNTREKYVR